MDALKMDPSLQWKKYFSAYWISENGDCFSDATKMLKKYVIRNGSKTMTLQHDNKQMTVKIHKVVAELFVPNEKCLKCIIFIDGDKLNANYKNLIWSSNNKILPEVDWFPIKKYEDTHEISSLGIRNVKTGNLLKLSKDKYPAVFLSTSQGEIRVMIHILMAKQFIPNPENLPVVNHKNNDPSNWQIENLEWCTYSENTNHFLNLGQEKLPKRGYTIRELNDKGEIINNFPSGSYLARILKVSDNTVRRAIEAKRRLQNRIFEYDIVDIPDEKWKGINTPFSQLEHIYEVSDYGRVRKIGSKMPLNQGLNNQGYFHIFCYAEEIGYQQFSVARLVAFSFTESKDFEKEVNHKNKIVTDNRLSNLEILDTAEHRLRDHSKAIIGVNRDTARIIAFRSRKEAALFFNVSPGGIWQSMTYSVCSADHYWFDAYSKEAQQLIDLSGLILVKDITTKEVFLLKK